MEKRISKICKAMRHVSEELAITIFVTMTMFAFLRSAYHEKFPQQGQETSTIESSSLRVEDASKLLLSNLESEVDIVWQMSENAAVDALGLVETDHGPVPRKNLLQSRTQTESSVWLMIRRSKHDESPVAILKVRQMGRGSSGSTLRPAVRYLPLLRNPYGPLSNCSASPLFDSQSYEFKHALNRLDASQSLR
jgi:hypothetical protein